MRPYCLVWPLSTPEAPGEGRGAYFPLHGRPSVPVTDFRPSGLQVSAGRAGLALSRDFPSAPGRGRGTWGQAAARGSGQWAAAHRGPVRGNQAGLTPLPIENPASGTAGLSFRLLGLCGGSRVPLLFWRLGEGSEGYHWASVDAISTCTAAEVLAQGYLSASALSHLLPSAAHSPQAVGYGARCACLCALASVPPAAPPAAGCLLDAG